MLPTSRRRPLLAAAALLALHAAPAVAQPAAPRAGAAAAATAFQDADVAWLLPLLDAGAADRRREAAQLESALDALTAGASDAAGAERVAALRSGAVHALDALRRLSPEAAVPPAARYDAACSAALTESTAGLVTTAAYSAPDVAGARAFYRARDWQVLGDAHAGYVLISPDGRLRGSLASALARLRRTAAEVERQGLRGHDHVRQCGGIPDGTGLLLQYDGQLEAEADARAASAATGAAIAERLPGALRAAGLTAEAWERIHAALWQADLDRLMPDTPSPEPATAAEAARRRANAAWLARHQGTVGARLEASSTGG